MSAHGRSEALNPERFEREGASASTRRAQGIPAAARL
jgi:hypothetical protein